MNEDSEWAEQRQKRCKRKWIEMMRKMIEIESTVFSLFLCKFLFTSLCHRFLAAPTLFSCFSFFFKVFLSTILKLLLLSFFLSSFYLPLWWLTTHQTPPQPHFTLYLLHLLFHSLCFKKHDQSKNEKSFDGFQTTAKTTTTTKMRTNTFTQISYPHLNIITHTHTTHIHSHIPIVNLQTLKIFIH